MKSIEMLINELKASEDMQKLLVEAVKNNAVASFLREQGCEATAEEFIAAIKGQAEQLSDDALNAVAGGANGVEVVISICSFGFGCVAEAIRSACDGGTGDGPDGRILCNSDGDMW